MTGSIEKSEQGKAPPTTVFDLVERYCEEIVLRPASKETYRVTVRVFAKDTGIHAIEAITHEIVLKWRDAVIQRASLTSWNTYRRGMKTLFNLAVANGWVHANPFLEVKPLALSKMKRTVTKSVLVEALVLLKSDDGDGIARPGWFWAIVLKLLFFTGMRRRQLASLRWRDIDFDRGVILLSMEGSKTRHEWEIPIPNQCVDDLRHLRSKSKARHEKLEDRQVFWVQLFDSSYAGIELTPEQVSYAFYRLSKRLGTKVSAHRLRHSMATELAQGSNPDLKTLQYLLGHSNLATTLEYVHPEMEQLRLQLDRLKLD